MNLKKEMRNGGGKFVLALGAALVALESMAATHTVSTEAELVAAVAAAAGKDTILLKSGTYDLSLVEPQNPKDSNGIASIFVDNKTLHFVGEDATSWRAKADNTTGVVLKGTNTARIMYGYAGSGRGSTFRHITFDGGVAPSGKNGGAIYFMDCRFNGWASNCVFRNCRAYDGGATMYVTLRDCLFENNEASHMGGAAFCGISTYNDTKSVNEIRNCEFRENRAPYGGAVRWFGQGVTAGCMFRTNCATTAGGAMHANNAPNGTFDLSFALTTNCLFEGNFGSSSSVGSDYGGGAVWQPGPTVNCTFIGNSYSNNYGGALYKAQGGVTGCVFRANVGRRRRLQVVGRGDGVRLHGERGDEYGDIQGRRAVGRNRYRLLVHEQRLPARRRGRRQHWQRSSRRRHRLRVCRKPREQSRRCGLQALGGDELPLRVQPEHEPGRCLPPGLPDFRVRRHGEQVAQEPRRRVQRVGGVRFRDFQQLLAAHARRRGNEDHVHRLCVLGRGRRERRLVPRLHVHGSEAGQ